MKVWMRERAAPCRASAARAMSRSLARASEHTVESLMAAAIALTASKSPLLEAAKPASITSTRRRSSWRAMRSFSSLVIEAPGDCSPSRKVVSKMISLSMLMIWLSWGSNEKSPLAAKLAGCRWQEFGNAIDQRAGSTPSSSGSGRRRIDMAHECSTWPSAVKADLVRVRRSRWQSRWPACPWPCCTDVDDVARNAIEAEQRKQDDRRIDVDHGDHKHDRNDDGKRHRAAAANALKL